MQTRRPAAVVLTLVVLTFGATDLSAQARAVQLTEPDATFPEAFSLILRLREMRDGRVLVPDPLGQALVLADFAAGTADTLGRVGQGPGEYRQPDAVFPLPGDSTLLVDLGNARLTALGPDGTFGLTMPIAQGEPAGPGLGGMVLILPQDVDGMGRLYFQPPGLRMGGGDLPDSSVVVRFDRARSAFDTVATVKIQERRRTASGGGNNRNVSITSVPYSPQDGWAVAPDGRIAVVRSGGYYVEWIQPDGRVVRGDPVRFRPVRIGRAEKEEWVTRRNNGLAIGMSINNGQRQMSLTRGGGRRANANLDEYLWPEHKPAFDPTSVRIDLAGNLWVERSGRAGQPRTYDVFDAAGRLAMQVTVPAGRRVIGFGRGRVYLVYSDEYDLQYLERYRLAG